MDGTDLRNQSLSELISSLTEQMSRLVRAELALAKAELFANARQAILGGGLLSAAALVGLTAWFTMVGAAIAGIAEGLPPWAALIIMGVFLGALAGGLALLGRSRLARGMPPLPVTAGTVRRELHELTRPNHNGIGRDTGRDTGRNGTDGSVPGQRTALNGPAPQEEARR